MDVSIDFSSEERNELLQILARASDEAAANHELPGPNAVKRAWYEQHKIVTDLMTKIMSASPR